MSLDVWLKGDGATAEPERWAIFIRENGETREISRAEWDRRNPGCEPAMVRVGGESQELWSRNITHNLTLMAEDADLYGPVWRPDENDITHARQLIEPLTKGLKLLRSDPDRFEAYNPPNGWGNYEGLVAFVEDYLTACRMYPDATVHVWR